MTSVVKTTDVRVSFNGHDALGASTLGIPAGAVTAVIGPNGSGKSTLLNLIAGLIEPTSGSIEVFGVAPAKARQRISYVLQTTKVNEAMPVTVREVVSMGCYSTAGPLGRLTSDDRSRVQAAMERLDIADISSSHLSELSGGQRQRVFVAQGLAQTHSVLLLDEPLTGLDLISAETIASVIADERATGCSVIFTTHDLAEAEGADFVVLLSGGLIAAGPPASVITAGNLTEAYGQRILEIGDGRVMVDDPAHQPVPGRHQHVERSIHLEAPGSDLHEG